MSTNKITKNIIITIINNMIKGILFLENIDNINNSTDEIVVKYLKMRSLLEQVCYDLTQNYRIQFTNLFSRLDYICEIKKMKKRDKYKINRFRINANNVIHSKYEPSEEEYRQDLKALCTAISFFYGTEIPHTLNSIFPKNELIINSPRRNKKVCRIRVSVLSIDDMYINVSEDENPTEEPIKVKYNVKDVNDEFNETVNRIWPGCQLNLIEVTVDEQGIYLPEIIILEPDYLIDISSIAECMKDYGNHPLNYIQSKLEPIKNTRHILLGNVVNLFFDELINETEQKKVTWVNSIKKSFHSAPLEFSTCEEIDEQFFKDSQIQFNNIVRVVSTDFHKQNIDREKGIVEPSFMCEQLGIQGRLDFFQYKQNQDGKQFVIELKSGKAPFPEIDYSKIGINHQSQAFLYQIIVQKILGVNFTDLQTYILYSKYTAEGSNLRLVRPYMKSIKEILNIRNVIVANENSIVQDKHETKTKEIINSISPESLITKRPLTDRFIAKYIIPNFIQFKSAFVNASDLELEYFHSFYSFVTKEHYLSKVGNTEQERTKGISMLWLSSIKEKKEAGEILLDLSIKENKADAETTPYIVFQIPVFDLEFLPNFRQGDIVIIYERNKEEDNATTRQIFKGTIEILSPNEIKVRLRFIQRNKSVLPQESKYAIEHDFLDSSYNSMYRGLYSFLQANKERKDLLLNQRQPEQNADIQCKTVAESSDIQEIVHKAVMAKDYFLLVGPPGTGKTSRALKSMVEEFYGIPDQNILLLSYTNRAVDEICDVLEKIKSKPNYLRIGSELSCDEKYRNRLLERVISKCEKRDEVKQQLQTHRIYVGTVASLSGKIELFKLKHFDIAIIDEASQILEPHIIGLLSAKDSLGNNAIEKFILIGDHKQLPAVVLQNEVETKVTNQDLIRIGLTDKRNSLFERLYNLHKSNKKSLVWSMLFKQGRMHPDVAKFPNDSFYNSQLQVVPSRHQNSELEYNKYDTSNALHKLIATRRVAFIPSNTHANDKSNKVNTYEALIIKTIVKNVFDLYKRNNIKFTANETIGVITPYRSQIALIKREIHSLNIQLLNDITVDTVERFQGSQRDIIIYSFCVNDVYQLNFLAANTIIDEEQSIDRKLNVAITRAKKQLFITGNPSILWNNSLYYRYIEFVRTNKGYIHAKPEDFLNGNFEIGIEPQIIIDNSSIESVYESIIETLDKPSFKQILNTVRNNCYCQCPGNNICMPWAGLNHGTDLLKGHKNLCKYLCAYGDMHEKKFISALNAFSDLTEILKSDFSIIDWGCGQGLATVCFFDYLNEHHIQNKTSNTILIEPSEEALNRAKLHINAFLNNKYKIKTVNKYIDDVSENDIETNTPITFHFFSNILDITTIDLQRLSEIIQKRIIGEHFLICVGPLNYGNNRMDNFLKYFNSPKTLAQYEERQFINVNGWRSVKYLIFKAEINIHV
jgi:hypothetical protein